MTANIIDSAFKSMASNSASAPKPETLTDLAVKIKATHEQLVAATRGVVDRAIGIGKDLLKAQAAGGWGKWGKWLKENCAMQERNANRYIYLAKHEAIFRTELPKINSDTMSELTLAGAKQLIDKARIAAGQLTRTPPQTKDKPKPKATDVYKTKQEELIEVLRELSSLDHAEEYAEKTKQRLDETIAAWRKQEEQKKAA
jgi:hypothetical protein